MDYVDQEYWDRSYKDLDIESLFYHDSVVELINKVIRWSDTKQGDVMEIGCYPGRYLRVFAENGYCVSGLDTTPKASTELTSIFRARGYCVGTIACGDIFKYTPFM